MGPRRDDDGGIMLGAQGEVMFETLNNPFARQIVEFSSVQASKMGNGQKP
jgi:hypothetical protein